MWIILAQYWSNNGFQSEVLAVMENLAKKRIFYETVGIFNRSWLRYYNHYLRICQQKKINCIIGSPCT